MINIQRRYHTIGVVPEPLLSTLKTIIGNLVVSFVLNEVAYRLLRSLIIKILHSKANWQYYTGIKFLPKSPWIDQFCLDHGFLLCGFRYFPYICFGVK